MGRLSLLGIMLAATLAAATPRTASAQTAEEIFRYCNERIHTITERCVARHREIVSECSPRIRELIAAGQIEAARDLARRCIEQINTVTRNCIERIRTVCRECIDKLNSLGATELAEQLRVNCERAIKRILESRTHSINAIKSLFPNATG
jgi:hypothetical protein